MELLCINQLSEDGVEGAIFLYPEWLDLTLHQPEFNTNRNWANTLTGFNFA